MKRLIYINIFIFLAFAFEINAQDFNDLNSKSQLARSFELSGELEKAEKLYEQLYAAQPFNVGYLQSLNTIYVKLKEYDKSITLLQKRLASLPGDLNAYGMLGSTYYTMGNNEKAYETWDKAISIDPSSSVGYRVISNYIIECRDYEKAITVLSMGEKKLNDPMIFVYNLASLYAATMKFDKAAEEYVIMILNQPEQVSMIKARINAYLSGPGAVEKSIEAVKKAAEDKDSAPLYDLLTFLYQKADKYEDAFNSSIKTDQLGNKDGRSIYVFAQDAFNNKKFDTASKAYRYLIDNYPSLSFMPIVKISYARTLEESLNEKYSRSSWKPYNTPDTTGAYDFAKIISAYNDIANKYRGGDIFEETQYRIGVIYKNRFDAFAKAEKSFNSVIATSPRSMYADLSRKELAELQIDKGNLDSAGSYYNAILKNRKADPALKNEADFMMGRIYFWKGDFKTALDSLAKASDNLENDFANDAIEFSSLINGSKKDSANLAEFANADLLSRQEKFDKAAQKFKILSENQNLFLLKDVSKFRYAQMLIAENNLPVAIQVLTEIADSSGSGIYSDRALFLLGNTYQYGILDKDKAVGEYEKLLEKFPNSLYFDRARDLINLIKTNKS